MKKILAYFVTVMMLVTMVPFAVTANAMDTDSDSNNLLVTQEEDQELTEPDLDENQAPDLDENSDDPVASEDPIVTKGLEVPTLQMATEAQKVEDKGAEALSGQAIQIEPKSLSIPVTVSTEQLSCKPIEGDSTFYFNLDIQKKPGYDFWKLTSSYDGDLQPTSGDEPGDFKVTISGEGTASGNIIISKPEGTITSVGFLSGIEKVEIWASDDNDYGDYWSSCGSYYTAEVKLPVLRYLLGVPIYGWPPYFEISNGNGDIVDVASFTFGYENYETTLCIPFEKTVEAGDDSVTPEGERTFFYALGVNEDDEFFEFRYEGGLEATAEDEPGDFKVTVDGVGSTSGYICIDAYDPLTFGWELEQVNVKELDYGISEGWQYEDGEENAWDVFFWHDDIEENPASWTEDCLSYVGYDLERFGIEQDTDTIAFINTYIELEDNDIDEDNDKDVVTPTKDITSPKTGDSTNMGLLMAIAIISMVIVASAVIVARRHRA